jgi:uncharacterized membrane protein SirB2
MAMSAVNPHSHYFARTSVQLIVLGAFFLLTLPLLFAVVKWGEANGSLVNLYGVTFGLTHFLVTGLIYLDARNLRYFASSLQNRLIYFVIPIVILVGMDLLAVLRLGRFGASINGFLFYFVMFANFLHVSRQSFGVLQLFKREARASHSDTLRSLENLFFVSLVVCQFLTFAAGGTFAGRSLGVWLTAGLTCLIFAIALGMHIAALRQGVGCRADGIPIVYFVLQAISGALVVYRSDLVTIALAMHYVEYHVVMMPRVLRSPVDPGSVADRLRAALGKLPVLFYAGLAASAWGVYYVVRTKLYLDPEAASLGVRIALHSLDGIFLFHFFVEAFLWKFSKPHYRETLGPLYFAPAAARGR